MFIENAWKSLHKPWMYLVGAVVSFLASQLGGVFLLFFVGRKWIKEGKDPMLLTDQSNIMTALDSNTTFFLMLSGFAIGLVVLFLFVKRIHKQQIKDLTTTRSKVDGKRILFGFLLVAVPSLLLTLTDYWMHPEDYILQFDWLPFLGLLVIALIFIPIQTSFEEYIFRGYLLQGIGVNTRSRILALWIPSLIFGGMHLFNPEVTALGYSVMIYYIGAGLFLGIITLMDEGLELALGYHAGNNLIIALLVTSEWTVFQTNSILKDTSAPSLGIEVFFMVLLMYPIFIFLLAKKYKWVDFRTKLFGKVEESKIEIE